jgi:hypothetical protein
VIEHQQLALQRVERLDLRPRGVASENPLLERLDLGIDAVEHRKIAIDDGVHQRVKDVGRPVAQQFGLLFAAAADFGEAVLGAAAHRNDVLRSDEDRHLAGDQIVARPLDHLQHDEQRRAVLLDLGALVPVLSVFDRELVEVELLLQRGEFPGRRVLQRQPDEASGRGQVLPDVADRDVGELLSAFVGDAVDQHVVGVELVGPPGLEPGTNRL